MIEEILQNKFIVIVGSILLFAILYKLFLGKDKAGELVEREYEEIIRSDKYKVKGQHD